MAYYFYRDADLTATGKTTLSNNGSDTSAGSITAPTDVKKISKIVAAFGILGGSTATWGVLNIRLGGSAVKNGEQVICVGDVAELLTTSGQTSQSGHPFPIAVDIPVTGGNQVTVTADLVAGAVGTSAKVHVGCTVELS